jgi:hypothetical protein
MAFFKYFPKVDYDGHMATNLMARTKINKQVLINTNGTIDYTIQDGDRADIVSYLAFQDSEKDWIVYYSNDVVDPYHDWYMSTNDFNEFVAVKYGSISQAESTTVQYDVASPDGEERNIDHYGLAVNSETYEEDILDPEKLQLYTYTRLSAFTKETEDNASKLKIKLLSEAYAQDAEQQLIAKLKD